MSTIAAPRAPHASHAPSPQRADEHHFNTLASIGAFVFGLAPATRLAATQ